MKERSILFNGEMVRAILDGRKTQTRRPMKPQPILVEAATGHWEKRYPDLHVFPFWDGTGGPRFPDTRHHNVCPFGQPGDRLWVRESIRVIEWRGFRQCRIRYEADTVESDWMDYPARLKGGERELKGRLYPNGAFREAARTWLEITSVRVERVQEITEKDARAEGAPLAICGVSDSLTGPTHLKDFRTGFVRVWNDAYSERSSWGLNPWVWVVEFRRTT